MPSQLRVKKIFNDRRLSDVKEAKASTFKDVGKKQKVHNILQTKTIFWFEAGDDNYQWPR